MFSPLPYSIANSTKTLAVADMKVATRRPVCIELFHPPLRPSQIMLWPLGHPHSLTVILEVVFASYCIARISSQQVGVEEGATRLDADPGLAPMSPLRVVPVVLGVSSMPSALEHTWSFQKQGAQSYLMVLPVLRRTHCGMGRFCFCALASFCFVRKVLCDCGRLLISLCPSFSLSPI